MKSGNARCTPACIECLDENLQQPYDGGKGYTNAQFAGARVKPYIVTLWMLWTN